MSRDNGIDFDCLAMLMASASLSMIAKRKSQVQHTENIAASTATLDRLELEERERAPRAYYRRKMKELRKKAKQ